MTGSFGRSTVTVSGIDPAVRVAALPDGSRRSPSAVAIPPATGVPLAASLTIDRHRRRRRVRGDPGPVAGLVTVQLQATLADAVVDGAGGNGSSAPTRAGPGPLQPADGAFDGPTESGGRDPMSPAGRSASSHLRPGAGRCRVLGSGRDRAGRSSRRPMGSSPTASRPALGTLERPEWFDQAGRQDGGGDGRSLRTERHGRVRLRRLPRATRHRRRRRLPRPVRVRRTDAGDRRRGGRRVRGAEWQECERRSSCSTAGTPAGCRSSASVPRAKARRPGRPGRRCPVVDIRSKSGGSRRRAPPSRLWIDGQVAGQLTGLDTRAFSIETVRLGPSSGLVKASSGELQFDRFVSTRGSTIGP